MISFLTQLFKPENKQKQKPIPAAGQVWSHDDNIVDMYCTPIVLTIQSVSDEKVFYTSNFCGEHIFEEDKEKFTSTLKFQSNGVKNV